MNSEKLWTKNFVTLSLINFLVFLIHLLLMVIIATYAISRFNVSTSMAGLVASIFIIGALIGRFGTGRVIEEIGGRRVLIAGTVFFIIVVVLYFASFTLTALILVRFLHGVAHAITSTATGTIVAKIVPAKKRGEGIGYYGMSVILASALGPFIGLVLIQHVNFNVVFFLASAIAVAVFFISLAVNEPFDASSRTDDVKTATRFRVSDFFEYQAIPISVVALIIGFSGSVVIAFISLYAAEIHLEEAAGLYFVVNAIASLVSRPVSGRLFDLKGANFVIYPCLFIYAAGMLLFSQAGHGLVLLLAGAAIGVGYGNFMSCAQALSLKAVSPRRFGLATATYYVFLDFGIGIGPYLLGFLIPWTGYRGLYLIISILILATLPLYYFLLGRKEANG